jgi:predicted nucleotidyltransferase
MLNETETEIIGLLLKSPLEAFTIRSISKIFEKQYSYAHRCIKRLEKKKIIKVKTAGNSSQCRIDFENVELDSLVAGSSYNKKQILSKTISLKVIEQQLKEGLADNFYICLLFGSYAKGMQKKDSDIDLMFLVDDEKKTDSFKKKVDSIVSSLEYKVHAIVSSVKWFYQMMAEKGSVGNEAFKNSIVFHNPEAYYLLVKRHDKERGN